LQPMALCTSCAPILTSTKIVPILNPGVSESRPLHVERRHIQRQRMRVQPLRRHAHRRRRVRLQLPPAAHTHCLSATCGNLNTMVFHLQCMHLPVS